MSTRRNHTDYTLAWVCPLEIEQTAAIKMLDESHEPLEQERTDYNTYTLGRIGRHNIVIAALHQAGNSSATSVVTQIRNTFPDIRSVLLVGIGGGVPVKTSSGIIRLGDIVVSKPAGEYPGVVQYDHGKAEIGVFKRTGALQPPPAVLLHAAQDFAVNRTLADEAMDPLTTSLSRITSDKRLKAFHFPGRQMDFLYESDYAHLRAGYLCSECKCDPAKRIRHDYGVDEAHVQVHRGVIASGELVIKDAKKRDELAAQHGVLCFETEAAGVLADTPCLVIRGISDYCDSHKNDQWHGYAAATAAAYSRELVLRLPMYKPKQSPNPGHCGDSARARILD
ncbi:nucleoside phosphorylase domain-containing protein [Aspergillus keveii]|uniref:Nucleoside phosphorylase domain-containing protein n=1 Tax=Aspergillus keveii TaxID=714993 RepID=A0ABR4G8H5_9EURO